MFCEFVILKEIDYLCKRFNNLTPYMNSNNRSTYRLFLQLKLITKYGIFGLAFISLLYCILTSFGLYVPWLFIAYFSFAFVLRIVLSKAFGLCWIHRSCILYNYFVSLLNVIKPETFHSMFGMEKQTMIGVLAIIGIILFGFVVWRIKSKKTC